MRSARTGPIPGRDSNSGAVARFRFSGPERRGEVGPAVAVPDCARITTGGRRPSAGLLAGRGTVALPGGRPRISSPGRSFSSVEDPTPRTRIRSLTERKGAESRAATMARASPGPTPGSRSSSASEARLGSRRSPAARGRVLRSASAARIRAESSSADGSTATPGRPSSGGTRGAHPALSTPVARSTPTSWRKASRPGVMAGSCRRAGAPPWPERPRPIPLDHSRASLAPGRPRRDPTFPGSPPDREIAPPRRGTGRRR